MRTSSRCHGSSLRRALLEEVEQVLLGQAELAAHLGALLLLAVPGLLLALLADDRGPPDVVKVLFEMATAILLALALLLEIELGRPVVAVDAVVHQRVGGVDARARPPRRRGSPPQWVTKSRAKVR